MIAIPLRNRSGEVIAKALIDDEDGLLARETWYLQKKGYATRQAPNSRKKLLLHRVILNAPPGVKVDHWNRDGLDFRRNNLRLATNAQNCQNRSLNSNNKAGYKGVRMDRGYWRATIRSKGKLIHLGLFKNVIDAAHAYDSAATALFGKFAAPNFV